MNIHPIVGVAYFFGVTLLSAAPLDDKIKAFEEAVKKTPPANTDAVNPGIFPRGRVLTVEFLDQAMQQNADDMTLEGIVSRLMTTHPSDAVNQTGGDILTILEGRRKEHAKAFETKAQTLLAKTPGIVTHAGKAADLDEILGEFQALQKLQEAGRGQEINPGIATEISSAFEFLTQWQNYLAASGSGNWQEAQNNLRAILYNREIDAPNYFPRSQILEKYEKTFHGGVETQVSSPGTGGEDESDKILKSITEPEGEESKVGQLAKIPSADGQVWDWSVLIELVKKKDDVLAGLSTDLDLKKIMSPPVFGDDISRITAMELLVILPHYFGTNITAPPKAKETIAAYLDRLIAGANADGNLALMQRVITVQVALSTAENPGTALGTQQFLAGLSQDAAGQYAPAVISYENALKDPDSFLPIKIVGERLAAIKAAHPDEFERGMTAFLAPPESDPRFPPGMPWMQQRRLGNPAQFQVSVLPIPMTITIPPPDTGAVQKPTSINPAPPSSP